MTTTSSGNVPPGAPNHPLTSRCCPNCCCYYCLLNLVVLPNSIDMGEGIPILVLCDSEAVWYIFDIFPTPATTTKTHYLKQIHTHPYWRNNWNTKAHHENAKSSCTSKGIGKGKLLVVEEMKHPTETQQDSNLVQEYSLGTEHRLQVWALVTQSDKPPTASRVPHFTEVRCGYLFIQYVDRRDTSFSHERIIETTTETIRDIRFCKFCNMSLWTPTLYNILSLEFPCGGFLLRTLLNPHPTI